MPTYEDYFNWHCNPEFVTIDISDSRSLRRLKRWMRRIRQQAKRQVEKERKHKDA